MASRHLYFCDSCSQ
ncbi:MAG: hypothetical protein ACKOKF_12740 [Bacteroidota bacterium]